MASVQRTMAAIRYQNGPNYVVLNQYTEGDPVIQIAVSDRSVSAMRGLVECLQAALAEADSWEAPSEEPHARTIRYHAPVAPTLDAVAVPNAAPDYKALCERAVRLVRTAGLFCHAHMCNHCPADDECMSDAGLPSEWLQDACVAGVEAA